MNLDQVISLCERIRQHRPAFKDSNELWNEWHKFLKKYDNEEVNKSLETYLKYDFEKRTPTVIELIKDLTPLEEYRNKAEYMTNCKICGRYISSLEYDKHFDRCSSIDYVTRMAKKYYDKEINKGELWKMDDIKFAQAYWKFCEKLIDNEKITEMEKKSLTNAILTHYGYDPEHSLEDVITSK